jgi:hypothetical protein
MGTANDALITKANCAKVGYIDDRYVDRFVENNRRMLPIINRGTWARVQAYRQVIDSFITTYQSVPVNIVSLGAGHDTTIFWMLEHYKAGNKW